MAIGSTLSIGLIGLRAFIVQVQAFISPGLPYFTIIGLPDASLSEARERVKSACHASGFAWPQTRVTVNMSPAATPKRGSSHDLAIAASVLCAAGAIGHDCLEDTIMLGEVNLDGSVLPIHGLLPIMLHAEERGIRKMIIPYRNLEESAMVDGLDVVGVRHVGELIELMGGKASYTIPDLVVTDDESADQQIPADPHTCGDMNEVLGQEYAKWALQVAAAGGHNLIMTGPPGAGKTMLASRLPGIMSPLTESEQLEVASIRSLCGTLPQYGITDVPPFEAPHHTATTAALVGGGSGIATPGAITRAHRGILFLDEAPEFSARALQTLREPLESGYVALSRSKGSTYYPARFQLIMAANPCPCGYYYGTGERCTCREKDRMRYFSRLAGPVLDRVDIQLAVPPVSRIAASNEPLGESSATIRARVLEARTAARQRFREYGWTCNAQASGNWLHTHTSLKAMELVNRALSDHRLTLRGADRAMRLAWTLADLRGRVSPHRTGCPSGHRTENEDVMTGSNTTSSVTTSTTSTTSSTGNTSSTDAHAGAGTHAATGANAGASTHAGTSTHAATGANANVPVQHPSPRSAAIPAPTIEALYRAALTFCLDGTDVMMYATLKGAPSAESLWHALAQSHPSNPDNVSDPALGRIDRMFVNGITRWGRSVSADMMASFRTSLASWHNRMRDLPSQDIMQLANWFTVDGTMWLIGPDHPCWPHQLADLAIRSDWAPPLCLWIRGDPRALTSCPNPIGIVGSRDVNEYGRYVAHTMAEQAAAAGHLVVSGGAMGTDAAAHWGALNALHGRTPANVGKTVAVFAGGLNHMGPMRNRTLFERIEAQGGALISEHCPNTIPEARRFLLRNRIIAALSSTLVVAQARLRSGALNTAGWACELMREVYAVPGDINQPGNAGCNKMISDHRAILLCAATSTEDICHERHRPIMTTYAGPPGTLSKAGSTGQPTHETAQSTASSGASLPAEEETATGTAAEDAASPTSPAQTADQRPRRSAPPGRPSNARAMKPASGGMPSSARQRMPDMPDITPHESRTASAASEARRSPTAGTQPTLMQTTLLQTMSQSDSIGRYDDGPVGDHCHQDTHAGTSTRRMPDLRTPSESQEDAEPRIDPNTLPEPQREMVGLIRECRRRHLIVTPDALLRVARELHNDEIPNIGTVLELLGALELKGVVTRQADGVMLSDRVR